MAGIQMGGIVSGLDTTSIVTSLMKVEQLKVDKVQQQKTKLQWQQEAYVKVSDRYADFILKMRDNFGIKNSVSTHGLTRPGTINNLTWLNKATSSNESILTTKVTSEAKAGKYEAKVKQLADSFKSASSSNISVNKQGTNLAEQLGIDPETQINFEISDGNKTITINKKASEMTMTDLVNEINQLDGVTASYDKDIDRFFIQTTETGSESQLKIVDNSTDLSGSTGALLSKLQLDNIQSGQTYRGQDAIIDFNGANDITFSTNNFSIQGIEFSLNSANVNETVTVNISTDVDAVVEKVQTFVNEYNTLITDIGKILGEATYRDYDPLTDEQKEEMTEKEIELWETKAKSGLLKNDSIINSIQQNLKSSLIQNVNLSDGSTLNLYNIGIQTKGYQSAATSGELQIDEEKLRAAISSNPNQVVELLFATPSDSSLNTSDRNLSSSQIQQKRQESGLFNRMTDIMTSGMSQIFNKAGVGENSSTYRSINSFIMTDFSAAGSKSILDNRLLEINKRIVTLNARMETVETRYWKQFTAMETAISNLQSQQSLFSSL